jgi:hypothetical protein
MRGPFIKFEPMLNMLIRRCRYPAGTRAERTADFQHRNNGTAHRNEFPEGLLRRLRFVALAKRKSRGTENPRVSNRNARVHRCRQQYHVAKAKYRERSRMEFRPSCVRSRTVTLRRANRRIDRRERFQWRV